MIRTLGPLGLLLVLAACDFPEVPRGAGAAVDHRRGRFEPVAPDSPPLFAVGAQVETGEPIEAERPVEVRGRLVGNAVSSYVIATEERGTITLEIVPETELRIGGVQAGLREIQPGSEVRARFVPIAGGRFDLALEVEADPRAMGWSRDRHGSSTSGSRAPSTRPQGD